MKRPLRDGAFLVVRAVLLGGLMATSSVPRVSAEQTYARVWSYSGTIDRFKGNQGIRTDPQTVQGIGYVHPTQMDLGAPGGDFIAVGTANGLGADLCADDYDAKWTVYGDWWIGGVYKCIDFAKDKFAAGSNPTFRMIREFCPLTGEQGVRWVLYFGGYLYRCINHSAQGADNVIAMLETTGNSNVDRNIDVVYTNLMAGTGGFNPWGIPTQHNAPSYTSQYVSNTAVNLFLTPLD